MKLTEQQYYDLLGEAESIMYIDPELGTPLSNRFEEIVAIIMNYEKEQGGLRE
jgi:hypothetical protein